MSASIKIIFPHIPIIVATILFTAFILTAEILLPYAKYVKILKYLTLSLFAYVLTAIIVGGNWHETLLATTVPYGKKVLVEPVEIIKDFVRLMGSVNLTIISLFLISLSA